jgi:hypothetical protein
MSPIWTKNPMKDTKCSSLESDDEEKEAAYEFNNNEYFDFYKYTSKKEKNECLVTVRDEMHPYLMQVAQELPNVDNPGNWTEVVKAKLVSMGTHDIKTTLHNIQKFNPTLMQNGRAVFFKITLLRRMIKISLKTIADENSYGNINVLIEKVASIRTQASARGKRRWIDFTVVRLCAIGI